MGGNTHVDLLRGGHHTNALKTEQLVWDALRWRQCYQENYPGSTMNNQT
jgi:hypothetical protein